MIRLSIYLFTSCIYFYIHSQQAQSILLMKIPFQTFWSTKILTYEIKFCNLEEISSNSFFLYQCMIYRYIAPLEQKFQRFFCNSPLTSYQYYLGIILIQNILYYTINAHTSNSFPPLSDKKYKPECFAGNGSNVFVLCGSQQITKATSFAFQYK